MSERHSLLARQLKRHFPDNHVPDALKPLLNDVADAYLQFDADPATRCAKADAS